MKFAALFSASIVLMIPALPAADPPANFSREQLVAWCIVPFDAKGRGPEERAKMLVELGLKRCAYDWREQHIAQFEAEILAYKKHGIEFTAFWNEHEAAFALFEKHGLKPQIWKICPSPKAATQDEKIAAAVAQLSPLAERCGKLGSTLGLYNHGGWGGEPDNLVAVCAALKAKGHKVGIVYNFHHAHDHIGNFNVHLKAMQDDLICLNLNGMNDCAEPKILTIGEGAHEKAMIQAVLASGYKGPIGIIDHLDKEDSQVVLQRNLKGLKGLLAD